MDRLKTLLAYLAVGLLSLGVLVALAKRYVPRVAPGLAPWCRARAPRLYALGLVVYWAGPELQNAGRGLLAALNPALLEQLDALGRRLALPDPADEDAKVYSKRDLAPLVQAAVRDAKLQWELERARDTPTVPTSRRPPS